MEVEVEEEVMKKKMNRKNENKKMKLNEKKQQSNSRTMKKQLKRISKSGREKEKRFWCLTKSYSKIWIGTTPWITTKKNAPPLNTNVLLESEWSWLCRVTMAKNTTCEFIHENTKKMSEILIHANLTRLAKKKKTILSSAKFEKKYLKMNKMPRGEFSGAV